MMNHGQLSMQRSQPNEENMRLFFAVTIPEEMVAQVQAVQQELRAVIGDEGVRWTRPEQFHYTLKFLGEQPLKRVYEAIEVARTLRETQAPFALTLGGVGAFPNNERPSVLWLGAHLGGDTLAELADRLDAALYRRRFRREPRPHKAHLTLARIKSYAGEAAAARLLRNHRVGELGGFVVDRFVLMKSILKPNGSEYTVVEEFRFPTP